MAKASDLRAAPATEVGAGASALPWQLRIPRAPQPNTRTERPTPRTLTAHVARGWPDALRIPRTVKRGFRPLWVLHAALLK